MAETVVRGQKGMSSVKELPVLQDRLPHKLPPVRYGARIPNTGPSGLTVMAVVGFMTFWGLYKVGQFNRYRSLCKLEKKACRFAITPYILAEQDISYVNARKKQLEEEARIMANVPGWVVGESVYHTKRWMSPMSDIFQNREWRL
ncbi:hypothetical protein SELMODRAFT_167299 [Selaginella moellendorffii]|uniref:NADH dehydrogenase [ubiquinone] 1 alpha subcomplex subunit 13 n=1 Tax=Selaginella moellendorffii TaxID=88036 RepID=D8R2I3_SELML|nr:NADH dehydrogenase [ubiquinone] 1 alpha subcomplex subunit 13-B [Selaginella moellendorffii]EFJ34074.1 hypothetical protein SELMODRAFT_167299 [Selaginella moellendorffii]|eukprot:XP_002965236.1 NADH dehydrogenase [ubiquinone] 1 alpha subcomplex subunit 13-B [Selaginella moellendorffii]